MRMIATARVDFKIYKFAVSGLLCWIELESFSSLTVDNEFSTRSQLQRTVDRQQLSMPIYPQTRLSRWCRCSTCFFPTSSMLSQSGEQVTWGNRGHPLSIWGDSWVCIDHWKRILVTVCMHPRIPCPYFRFFPSRLHAQKRTRPKKDTEWYKEGVGNCVRDKKGDEKYGLLDQFRYSFLCIGNMWITVLSNANWMSDVWGFIDIGRGKKWHENKNDESMDCERVCIFRAECFGRECWFRHRPTREIFSMIEKYPFMLFRCTYSSCAALSIIVFRYSLPSSSANIKHRTNSIVQHLNQLTWLYSVTLRSWGKDMGLTSRLHLCEKRTVIIDSIQLQFDFDA